MIKRFQPLNESKCLCGSGNQYQKCCKDDYSRNERDNCKIAFQHYREGKYFEAIKFHGYAITAYTILHKTNTHPFMNSDNKGVQYLFNLDLKAMSEMTDHLLDCFLEIGDTKLAVEWFENLKQNIIHPLWHRKVTYFQIRATLGKTPWDESLGQQETKIFLPLDGEKDADIFKLTYDLHAGNFSFRQKEVLLPKLIPLLEKREDVLLYNIRLSLNSFLYKEKDEAIQIAENAIKSFGEIDEDSSFYEKLIFAKAINFLSDMKESGPLKSQALNLLSELSLNPDLIPVGKAELLMEVGLCLFHKAQFEEAIKVYEESYKIKDDELLKIYIAQAYRDMNDSKAVEVIKNVRIEKLRPPGYEDYVFNYSYIAFAFNNSEMILNCYNLIKNLEGLEPLFEETKVKILERLSEYLLSKHEEKDRATFLDFLKNVLRKISKHVILQPNFNGIGINLNSIIDEFTDERKHSEKSTDKARVESNKK